MATLVKQQTALNKPKVYTLTLHPNTILVVTPPEKRTAVLSFKQKKCAIEFGRLIESHKALTKEWPNLSKGKIRFYDDGRKNPTFVDIMEWDPDELVYECGVRYMNIIDIECFSNNSKLSGKYKDIDMEPFMFKEYLDYIWNITP